MHSFIYGPVSSWRLGRSLGVDLLSTQGKTCNFDCVYCQLGRTANPYTQRREFVPIAELTRELESAKGTAADFVTFSGMGEPTLAGNLGQAIEAARSILRLPVAVLTNSSLTPVEEIRNDLAKADVVVAKMDARNQEEFEQVNRPTIALPLKDVLEGLQAFRARFKGKLCLQIMFIDMNKNSARDIAKLAESLLPDEIQLNTPLRPCAVKPLSRSQMSVVRNQFGELGNVITVYEASRPAVTPISPDDTLRRRPNLRC